MFQEGLGTIARRRAKSTGSASRRARRRCQNSLGYMYQEGRGVELNDAEAVDAICWRPSRVCLGRRVWLMYQRPRRRQSDAKAIDCYRAPGRQRGRAKTWACMSKAGASSATRAGRQWYHKAAEQRRRRSAQLRRDVSGREGMERTRAAVCWFRKAAEQITRRVGLGELWQ